MFQKQGYMEEKTKAKKWKDGKPRNTFWVTRILNGWLEASQAVVFKDNAVITSSVLPFQKDDIWEKITPDSLLFLLSHYSHSFAYLLQADSVSE